MTDVIVDLGGVPEMLQRLGATAGNLQSGLNAGGQYLKSKLATYPRERHGPQPFRTDKQRRGFFAKLKAGEIDVPYTRTGKLGQSWEVRASATEVIIGTRYDKAPLMQSRDDQTRYHKTTGWKTAEDVQERDGAQAVRIVEDTVKQLLP